ncbi:MAG: tRNA (5-methylaminomethyl-2-thiouridine)(34)-methyltransferase MnmD [Pirellulales bacterium]|nr:tRNA (5-methylaminomethyl-2-thiouridine)(34)-methyltransferase MnmD [Pirellulales bacterium]
MVLASSLFEQFLMAARHRPTFTTTDPFLQIQVTDDGSRTLIHRDSEVAFHSAAGAESETRHVYCHNSGVADRLGRGQPTSVLEVGLGTSMAMLITLDLARSASAPLEYLALESNWLPAGLIRQLHPWEWVSDRQVVQRYLDWRSGFQERVPAGLYRWTVDEHRQVAVQVGPAEGWRPTKEQQFDAIYFDPFAPDHNGELWQPEVMSAMYQALAPQGRLVTYCVNRKVRDMLAEARFDVVTVPGPKGGKRQVLVATKLP